MRLWRLKYQPVEGPSTVGLSISLLTIPLLLLAPHSAWGVAQSPVESNRENQDPMRFPSGAQIKVLPPPVSHLMLDVSESAIELRPSKRTLQRRLEATMREGGFGEPIRLRVEGELSDFLIQVATPRVRRMLRNQGKVSPAQRDHFLEQVASRLSDDLLELDGRDLSWIDLERLRDHIQISSRIPRLSRIDVERALATPRGRDKLEKFFGSHWTRVVSKLEATPNSDAPWVQLMELIPDHMQDLFGRYSAYRGRNCFGTALQFASADILADRTINLVREQHHHAAMINSDEFSHALTRGYTPLTQDLLDQGLRFGDVVVFFDHARSEGFRSLLHAAVHVGGRYYFHKPSKSPSSPVEFARWEDMVRVWRRHAKSLDYRAYRRIPIKSGGYPESWAISEKIDWTP